jgi:hypothetical protein
MMEPKMRRIYGEFYREIYFGKETARHQDAGIDLDRRIIGGQVSGLYRRPSEEGNPGGRHPGEISETLRSPPRSTPRR